MKSIFVSIIAFFILCGSAVAQPTQGPYLVENENNPFDCEGYLGRISGSVDVGGWTEHHGKQVRLELYIKYFVNEVEHWALVDDIYWTYDNMSAPYEFLTLQTVIDENAEWYNETEEYVIAVHYNFKENGEWYSPGANSYFIVAID